MHIPISKKAPRKFLNIFPARPHIIKLYGFTVSLPKQENCLNHFFNQQTKYTKKVKRLLKELKFFAQTLNHL